MHPRLIETLREAQRFGFFGDRPIEEAVDHSQAYVVALGQMSPRSRIIDLGSGGGLPGLVLADAFPDASVVLVDRRQKRTDFLQRAVRRLGWKHVEVVSADAAVLIGEVDAGARAPFDSVTARGFGPPEVTLRVAVALCRPGGRIVISEPPTGDRWDPGLLEELGVVSVSSGTVRVFERS